MSLHLVGVAARHGDHPVFQNVTFTLPAGERAALIGENGSGKTTLLRVIAGLHAPDAGTVHVTGRAAYLEQAEHLSGATLLDAALPGAIRDARATFDAAAQALTDPTPDALARFADAEAAYQAAGGYDAETRARAVLTGLHLDPDAPAHALSGGQTRRALLARLLLTDADLLLLDEPTNHLDAAAQAWLAAYLRATPAACLIASHDRAFLDETCTRTLELERGTLTAYPGPYTEAMQVKATLRAAQARDHAAAQRKRAALTQEASRLHSAGESAGRFNPARAGNQAKILAKNKAESVSNTLASRARTLERRLERMDVVEKPYEDHRELRLDLPPMPPGPSEVATLSGVTFARADQIVLHDLTLHVRRGDRLALVGPNGSGKTTLLHLLTGNLTPDAGSVTRGAGLRVATLGQHADELERHATIADALLAANPALTRHQLHEVAAHLGLPGQPDRPLSALSGGQRTRLILARLSVTRAHLLLLDEPTNHLDARATDALEATLRAFPGTVVLATHDRRLIQNVATRVLRLPAAHEEAPQTPT
ncbi:ABC-F family ATP-binding cassette domain-containing protein [Deinococcus maricopensis]|uniref:ABC transporter related protein n=1 Tax=Deinococcus maricopensis (strain DSM 21211 / LMG 22137 / NRRL B-23946 / LB-34) TaxID=709986 RepID=E8UB59_DEIML|nr:ABC-F family ATP-binding cassette domain-containing protein [Deinococcus maricopensis]ADV68298.1 ABC transporter related protein [Deinococcus maricopensis DSM 21211]